MNRFSAKIFDLIKPLTGNKMSNSYKHKYIWQLAPVGFIAVIYYSYLERLDEDEFLVFYDLKRVGKRQTIEQ